MRVALIALHFAEYSARLALALAARGHSVQLHLSASNAGQELQPELARSLDAAVDVRIHPHPARKYAPLHGFRIAAQLRGFRPQIVHAQEAAEWTVLMAHLLRPRVPLVYTVHDPLPHSGVDQAVRRRTLPAARRLRGAAAALLVHGTSVIPQMTAAEPSTAGRVFPVMHGLLGETADATTPPRLNSQFLFFGRIEAYKGLGVLLDAAKALGARGVDYRLTIAGRGADLDSHRAMIATMPEVVLDERYIPASEVPALFAASAAVVMPYLDATQSGVAAYAFAVGTPVIASRVGALPDVVTDGVNGLLVPPGDAAALADAMAQITQNPTVASTLSSGAATTAATILSWDAIAAETERIYQRLVSAA